MTGAAVLSGKIRRPGDPEYDQARTPWNRSAHHTPAMVVMAESPADVAAAVRLARTHGLGVGVMATGHGTAASCDGGLLVNTSRMRGIAVDAGARRAVVAAGAKWSDLVPAAARHGLACLQGSSSGVGVVGYTLGGGFGWLGRRHGFASSWVTRAELVTADGDLVRASFTQNQDLFWALRGGTGNFGIVASLEMRLPALHDVYAGNLYYRVEDAAEVLQAYAGWSRDLPVEMQSAVTFRRFPFLPSVPEPLRGGWFVAVRACWCGNDLEEGRELVDKVRADLGDPVVDTFAAMPVTAMDSVSADPVDPVGAHSHSELLGDLTPDAMEALVDVAGAGSGSPLVHVEARQLGGALRVDQRQLSPIGHSVAAYVVNAIGVAPTPDHERAVLGHLDRVAAALRPHATGHTYLNFLDQHGATPERVRAAYSEADWARLVALKADLDPADVFRFNRNITPTRRTP